MCIFVSESSIYLKEKIKGFCPRRWWQRVPAQSVRPYSVCPDEFSLCYVKLSYEFQSWRSSYDVECYVKKMVSQWMWDRISNSLTIYRHRARMTLNGTLHDNDNWDIVTTTSRQKDDTKTRQGDKREEGQTGQDRRYFVKDKFSKCLPYKMSSFFHLREIYLSMYLLKLQKRCVRNSVVFFLCSSTCFAYRQASQAQNHVHKEPQTKLIVVGISSIVKITYVYSNNIESCDRRPQGPMTSFSFYPEPG